MNQKRENAFLISVIGGATLLLLAVTVFAVASQARAVSNEAERSVTLIEQLRVVSISRAELSIASRVDATDSTQTVVIEGALTNAQDALDAVAPLIAENGSATVQQTFADYVEVSNAQANLIREDGTNPTAAQDAEVLTGERFDRLSTALRSEQLLALDELRKDNDLMNFIGTVATFIVAFIVPSAALYIFEALRRTPRHTRALELEVDHLLNRSQAMAIATENEAEKLTEAIFSRPDAPKGQEADAIRRSLLRLEHAASMNGSIRGFQPIATNVFSIVSDVADSLSADIDVAFGEADYPAVVLANNDQIALIAYELLLNAIAFGNGPIRAEIETSEHTVSLAVTDRGAGLPDVVETAIVTGSDYSVRNNLVSGEHGYGLLVVQSAVETLGGTLNYIRSVGETSMVVELPRSIERGRKRPAVTDLGARIDDSEGPAMDRAA